jgi:hypothetical protein
MHVSDMRAWMTAAAFDEVCGRAIRTATVRRRQRHCAAEYYSTTLDLCARLTAPSDEHAAT